MILAKLSPRALGPHPNAILHRLVALFAYPALPQLEMITQKVKALSLLPTVSHVGFVSTKTQAIGLYPGFHFRKRRFCFLPTAAKHHKIVGVANHAVALLLDLTVQSMKINVGQKRAYHRALRCAARWRPSLHFLDDVLLKKSFDQLKHSPIAHLFLNALHKPPVWDRVEVALKIGIHHKDVAFSKQPLHFPKRIFAAKPWTKAVTHLKELPLKDRLQHKLKRRQHALIPHRSFHQRPVPAMCLCTLCSPLGYCRRSAFALLHCETHASTFLSPFPRHGFAFRASRGFRRFGTMETLTPAPLTTLSAGLPAYCATPSCRSVSNHVGLPEHRLPPRQRVQRVSDFAMNEQARRSTPAESSSFTYGPTI